MYKAHKCLYKGVSSCDCMRSCSWAVQVLDALSQLGMTQSMTTGVLRDLALELSQGQGRAPGRLESARLLLQQVDKAAEQGGSRCAAGRLLLCMLHDITISHGRRLHSHDVRCSGVEPGAWC